MSNVRPLVDKVKTVAAVSLLRELHSYSVRQGTENLTQPHDSVPLPKFV